MGIPAATWQEMIATLRAACPVGRRVIVRRVVMRAHGSCALSDDEKTLTITIRAQDPAAAQRDSLIHEWAHARAIDAWEHGQVWGKQYSLAYAALDQFRE